MLENITLENFKGIPHLSMKLAPFTLISGANNIGKTSVLEAVFLMYNRSQRNVFETLYYIRTGKFFDINTDTRDAWANLFYDYKVEKPLLITARIDNKDESLELTGDNDWDSTNNTFEPISATYSLGNLVSISDRLKSVYKNDKHSVISHFIMRKNSNGDFHILRSIENNNDLTNDYYPNIYFSSDKLTTIEELSDSIGELIRYKQIPHLVEILKNLDIRINDIVLGEKQRIYLDVGLEEMIPLASMGSGIANIINWATIILRSKADILLIDEIESGIHYSSMQSVISELGKVGEKYNCQIIATTHSLDTVKSFSKYIQNNSKRGGYVRLERDKHTNNIVPKEIDSEALSRMLNSNWEVR